MKKKYLAIGWIILACTSAAFAEESINEQLQGQDQDREMLQSRVDQGTSSALIQAMHQRQFSYANMVQVKNIIQRAEQQGLPQKPLTDKVFEGIAKNIDQENIVRAILQVQSRYEHAFRQARQLTDDPDQIRNLGSIIAGSYTAGLTREECNKIQTQLQTRIRTMSMEKADKLALRTMNAARSMARRDVDSATVANVMVNALQHEYTHQDMEVLQNSFMVRSQNRSAHNAALQLANEISQGKGADEIGRNSGGGSGSSGGSGGGSGGSGGSGDGSGGSGGSGDGSGGSGGSGGGSGGSGGSGGGSGDSGGSGGGRK